MLIFFIFERKDVDSSILTKNKYEPFFSLA